MTLYDVLGMPPGAPHAELRRAYLGLARRSHPDVHATADPATRRGAEDRMRLLNHVWSVLGDPERRRAYDARLAHERLAASYGAGRTALSGTVGYGPGAPYRPWTGAGAHGARSGPHTAHRPWPAPGGGARHTPWPGGGAPRGRSAASDPRRTTDPTVTGSARAAIPADWRRFASPGPAQHRTLGARLGSLVPGALVGLALLLGALGVLMGSPSLVTLAGATAIFASLAFLAAPILAMTESRRHRRRPSTRAAAVPYLGGSRARF